MVVNPLAKDLSYSHTPTRKNKERPYARFLEIFRRLEVNVPFLGALEKIPACANIMKELLTNKRFIKQDTIQVFARCGAIFLTDLPPKLQDLGSFTIPITIGNLKVGKAILDLGASNHSYASLFIGTNW